MQETQVRFLVREDSTYFIATKSVLHLEVHPCTLESVLHNKRMYHDEDPMH